MNPETKHPYPGYYEAISDIIVKDDHTVTITLKTLPTPASSLNLARQGSVIYPREAVDTLKSAPIGTGPFRFEEWVRGRQDRAGEEHRTTTSPACPRSIA